MTAGALSEIRKPTNACSWRPDAEGILGKPDLPFLIVPVWINGQRLD